MAFNRKTYVRWVPGLAALVLAATLGASPLLADTTQTYTLDTSNLGSGFTGPFGKVTITCTSTTSCDVTFQAPASGYQFMDGQAADLNVSGSFAVTGFGNTQLATFHTNDPVGWNTTNNGNVDGFGSFNFTLNTDDGAGSAMDSITFILTATNGNSWADASSVLTPNAEGLVAAAHVAYCSGSPCTISNTGATTGYATTGIPTPEPASLALFGTGLLMLGRSIRRRVH